MPILSLQSKRTLWDSICHEFEQRLTGKINPNVASKYAYPFDATLQKDAVDSPVSSQRSVSYEVYDPCIHNPVFCCGQQIVYDSPKRLPDALLCTQKLFDPAVSHPAMVGYVLKQNVDNNNKNNINTENNYDDDNNIVENNDENTKKAVSSSSAAAHQPPPPQEVRMPNQFECSPREYLEYFIFPVLIPALEEMLQSAKRFHCFERRRTAFSPLDFLTEYLYKNNIYRVDERERAYRQSDAVTFEHIPFVRAHLELHPRVPLPRSLVWSEAEAATVIQAAWRGTLARRDPDIQELRQWQWEWREINADVRQRVAQFWKEREALASAKSSAASNSNNSTSRPASSSVASASGRAAGGGGSAGNRRMGPAAALTGLMKDPKDPTKFSPR